MPKLDVEVPSTSVLCLHHPVAIGGPAAFTAGPASASGPLIPPDPDPHSAHPPLGQQWPLFLLVRRSSPLSTPASSNTKPKPRESSLSHPFLPAPSPVPKSLIARASSLITSCGRHLGDSCPPHVYSACTPGVHSRNKYPTNTLSTFELLPKTEFSSL